MFTLEESLVLRAIPEGGATIDAVAREAKLSAGKVNALLVGLRLKGRVRFFPGNRVALTCRCVTSKGPTAHLDEISPTRQSPSVERFVV